MRQYADSSFLVSCYVTDANTVRANSFLSQIDPVLLFTDLQNLEVRNALNLHVFRRILSDSDARKVWKNLRHDVLRGRLILREVDWSAAFKSAGRLSERNTPSIGTRSLDILHVAVAKQLRVKQFLSFDVRQRALATAAGLTVQP